ncbi:MAG: DUF4082 domain-containing protein [Limisphaerales bacterium]
MKRLLFILCFAIGFGCWQTFADTLIIGTFGSSITPAVTSGYAFSFNQDVLISAVGIFDSGDNGLTTTNQLGIWTDSGSLLASKLFDSTVSPVLDSHFRWLSLDTPLLLSANTAYRVGTYGTEPGLQGAVGPASLSSNVTFIAEVGSSSGSFTFPQSSTQRTSGAAYIGPNLRYTVIPKLQVTQSIGSGFIISWPTNTPNFILESASSFPALTWDTVTNGTVIIGDQFTFGVRATNSQSFFRLHYQ